MKYNGAAPHQCGPVISISVSVLKDGSDIADSRQTLHKRDIRLHNLHIIGTLQIEQQICRHIHSCIDEKSYLCIDSTLALYNFIQQRGTDSYTLCEPCLSQTPCLKFILDKLSGMSGFKRCKIVGNHIWDDTGECNHFTC